MLCRSRVCFLTNAGEVWIYDSSDDSMFLINDQLPKIEGESSQIIYNILYDVDGVLWLSTALQGVYGVNFPRNQFNFINLSNDRFEQLDNSIGVRAICQTSNGDIWVGTRSHNLYRLSSSGEEIYCFDSKTYNIGVVYHIMEDANGDIWLSTKGSGLLRATADRGAKGGFRFVRYLSDSLDIN